MKTKPHRTAEPREEVGHFYESPRTTAARAPRRATRHVPPVVRYRRYPSLSDDHYPPLMSVRAVALLVVVAILIALAIA